MEREKERKREREGGREGRREEGRGAKAKFTVNSLGLKLTNQFLAIKKKNKTL